MQVMKENTCDKCRKCKNELYICLVCRNTTCSKCNMAVHGKPDTKSHKRILRQMNAFDYKFSYDLPIFYFSIEFYKTQFFSKEIFVQRIFELVHEVLLHNTENGSPMMLQTDLIREISERMEIHPGRVVEVLEGDFKIATIHQTTRNFGDFISLKYYSLCLNSVSVESIIWILKSIKNDQMQPNEALMFSRFKEYFAIKISMKDWKKLIESLQKSKELWGEFNQHKDVLGEIEIKEIEEGNYLFLLKGVTWVYEDLSGVEDNDADYRSFLAYIDEFFSGEQEDANPKENELKKWLSSVESSKKRTSSLCLETNYKKIMQNESINKAIPGGKYGCTLLIKNCGSELLKKLSIGRIYALIKHALNKQIINHLKTHIVKNDPKVSTQTQDKDQQIHELQLNILELLSEQENEGVTLAQLPLLLQKKYHKFYNIQDLGFPKLKNFLLTIENKIELTRSSNNHIKVSLKKSKEGGLVSPNTLNLNIDSISEHNQSDSQNRDYKLNYSTAFVNTNKSKKLNLKKPVTPYSEEADLSPDPYGFKCKEDSNMSASQFCEIFGTIKTFILGKLQRVCFGVEMNKLENELSDFLGEKFNANTFNASNFHHFLKMNFENELEITVKKTVKSKIKKGPTNPDYMIFRKQGGSKNLCSDQDSSFNSINQSIGSNQQGFKLRQDALFSDSSKGNKGNRAFDSNSDHSIYKNPVLLKNNKSMRSNLVDNDDLDIYLSFGYEDPRFPFHSKRNSGGDLNVNDTELTEEPEADEEIARKQRKFVNYVYDES